MKTQTTKDLDRLLPLTHEEQAMCYAIEHNEHIHIAQALAYLHWARARGCTLDAPRQTTLAVQDVPIVSEAQALLNSLPFDHEEPWLDEEGVLT